MKILGLTGQFCVGKSTVARMFSGLGAKIIDADKIGHKALLDKDIKRKLINYFGKDIISVSGNLDRKKLAGKAFLNKKNHNQLCRIVHPWLVNYIKDEIRKIKSRNPEAVVIIDAAVLVEMGLLNTVDKLILVKVDYPKQAKRARVKWSLSGKDFQKRIKLQIPLSRLIKKADFIIDNNGDLQKTKEQVKKVWSKLVPRRIL